MHAMEGSISRFGRAVCDLLHAWERCRRRLRKNLKDAPDYPCRKTRAGFQRSAFVILRVSVRDSDLINVRFGPLCGLPRTSPEVRELP
jgi:hypothetical protein